MAAALTFVAPFNQCSTSLLSHFTSENEQHHVVSREIERGSINKNLNHYELLGIYVDSNSQKIKETYRNLQKKYHPDIAGQHGHELILKINEAYKVLMRDDLRRKYDVSIGETRTTLSPTSGCSSWKGPLRQHALFVDESACIGCRECVHHAGNTFVIDEAVGAARVKLQYGDDDQNIEVSFESCPVNCIHWVTSEELPVLEFLMQPQPKEGHGIFGNGWEKPMNVFMAAKSFNKKLQRQTDDESYHKNASTTVEEESPAQAEARVNAAIKIKMEKYSRIWDSVKELFGSTVHTSK
ncbi:hypothetical protein ACFE04_012462 [Oxalis oulophora]